MKKDPAIEAIRLVRHQISAQFGHDTKALLAHYKEMEKKYADRILRESTVFREKSGKANSNAPEPFIACKPE